MKVLISTITLCFIIHKVSTRPQTAVQLPLNLLEDIKHEIPQNFNNFQQNLQQQGTRSSYLPPDFQEQNINQYQSFGTLQQPFSQSTSHQQLPYSPSDIVDEKKIYLQLPPQQYPIQPQYKYRTSPRKHYKIILVRAPNQPTPPPQPILPEVEEKTLVYVLVQKPQEPTPLPTAQSVKFNQPEVYFIKYKDNGSKDKTGKSLKQQEIIDDTIQKELKKQTEEINNNKYEYFNLPQNSNSRIARSSLIAIEKFKKE